LFFHSFSFGKKELMIICDLLSHISHLINCSIHPRDKQDVASRLVLSALQVAYNIKTMGRFVGPMISAFSVDLITNRMTLDFDNGTDPIRVKSMDGFEVRCKA
jgi:hypothetical protein